MATIRAKALPPVLAQAGGIAVCQLLLDAKASDTPCLCASHQGEHANTGTDTAMRPVSASD